MSDQAFPFPDKEACMRILRDDVCFGKIKSDDVQKVFDDAWNTGISAAENYFTEDSQRRNRNILEVLREENFTIEVMREDFVSGKYRYFCEYISEKNIVRIYTEAIQLWADQNRLPYEVAEDLILAHEYFHYLEWHKIGVVSRHYLVPMLKIGCFTLGKTGISGLSEIGANAFANFYFMSKYGSIDFGETSEKQAAANQSIISSG